MILKSCLLFLLLCSTILVESRRLGKNRQKMIIDQDAGADDAMAILMALLYEEYFQGPQVVALTTVNGNVNETQGFINTQRILDVADRRDIPIFRGADSALVTGHPTDEYFGTDGLGDVEQTYDPIQAQCLHAALAIIEYSKKYRGDLVLVTLGTLTNLALALKLDPKLLDRLNHVYVGAGNLYDEAFPVSTQVEFNVQLDVEAYKVLTDYATSEKVTVVPFSQIRRYFDITTDWRVNTLGAIPTKEIEAMNQFESVNIPKDDMWQLLDPVVMALALDKSLFDDIRLTKNSVVLCGDGASEGLDRRGITLNDLDAKEEYNMKLAYNGSVEDFKDFLYRVFSEPIRHGRNGG